MLGALLRRTPEERRRVLAAIVAEETSSGSRLGRLATQITEAREREAQARRELEVASRERAQLEGAQLVASAAAERQVVTLRHALAGGAPEEIARMQRDIAALVEAARKQARTVLSDGYQGLLDGRHATLVATNTDTIAAFLRAAREVTEDLEALKFAEVPGVERLGPCAELSLPGAQFEAAGRYDDAGSFVARVVTVPATLAERYAAIAGVAPPKPLLSPGEIRETERGAERSLQQRWNSGDAWR